MAGEVEQPKQDPISVFLFKFMFAYSTQPCVILEKNSILTFGERRKTYRLPIYGNVRKSGDIKVHLLFIAFAEF